jgi:hypothetical protein
VAAWVLAAPGIGRAMQTFPSSVPTAPVIAVAQPSPASTPDKAGERPSPMVLQDRALERLFSERLSALSPAIPEAYFLLAEEVADGAASDATRRRLAIRLYVLAYELDRTRAAQGAIAASACLGLASVTGAPRDRQFLSSLARTLDPRQAPPAWIDAPEIATSDSGGYRLAVLLGLVRDGEGLRARRVLEDRDVGELLDRYDGMLARAGMENGAFSVRREADRWPCPECHNDRVVRRMAQGEVEYRVCPACGGIPGPSLTSRQVLGQLRFEAWLLQGHQRSWASQMGMDDGAPLVDPDPAQIGPLFGVDVTLVLWRNGVWIADPSAVKAAEPVKDEEPPREGPASPAPNEPSGPSGS